jgi:hypothetical protein
VPDTRNKKGGETKKYTKDDAITREFPKPIKKAGIRTPYGVELYTLRRTAVTSQPC